MREAVNIELIELAKADKTVVDIRNANRRQLIR